MTRKNITTVIFTLFLLSARLVAGDNKGIFNLKEGEWFEMQITQSSEQVPDYYIYNLRYTLIKQLKNGNQLYQVSLTRFKYMASAPDGTSGYDSYYPPFIENKREKERMNQYFMEVCPSGKIVTFKPDKDNSVLNFESTQLNSKKRYFVSSNHLLVQGDSSLFAELSKSILLPFYNKSKTYLSNEFKILKINQTQCPEILSANLIRDSIRFSFPIIKHNNVPILIKFSNYEALLTSASFPIPGNTIIKGKVENYDNKTISILSKYNFQLNPDGTFYCPILLTRPSLIDLTLDNDLHKTFMSPGDTLDITTTKNNVEKTAPADKDKTNTTLYYNGKRIEYSNTAAFNTMLMKLGYTKIDLGEEIYKTDLNTFLKARESKIKEIHKVLNDFRGKASNECLKFVSTELDYYAAYIKLRYLEDQNYYQGDGCGDTQHVRLTRLTDYPDDFFLEVDTMPVLLNDFEWGNYFESFIYSSSDFKKMRLTISMGYSGETSDFYLSKASLNGYQLYKNLLNWFVFDKLKGGYKQFLRYEPDYLDFINNCDNPVMLDSVKKVYELAKLTKPGDIFPVKSFLLEDNSEFSLSSLKGKPVCMIFWNTEFNDKDSVYYKKISKFKPGEVDFVLIVMKPSSKDKVPAHLKNLKNIHVLEVKPQETLSFLNNYGYGFRRIILLDKWLRIVDDFVTEPIYNRETDIFEKSIRKAINAEHYTKEQKAAIYKTIGWSASSILITILIGIFVYRSRVKRVKLQEAVKRQIKELEIKAIRSQMNPHFIFNALNSIQSLINSNQFKEANIYLAKFAVLLRRVLHNSEKSMVSLSDEMEALELYCQLEQLRFEFELKINVDEHINCNLIEIPGMMIQPLAENAIVHGLSPKGGQGVLNITITQQNSDLHICVSDNGVGLPPKDNDSLRQKGFGLKLVEERLKIIKHDGKTASLTVVNKSTGNSITGTVAELIIPID